MLVARELKGELARIQPVRACCRRAELVGLLYAGRYREGVSTLDHATARIAVHLASSLGIAAVPARARPATTGRHHLRVAVDRSLTDGWHWSAAKSCDRRAFVRGVLLSASISMSVSGPHVEVVLRQATRARQLRSRLRELGVRGGVAARRGRHVVYVKGQDEIAALLQLAGANRALLDFESGRVARDVRNRLNRLLNAEEANLGRTVRAADRQLQAIAQLEAGGELERLPDVLRETAVQRRLQPDADLDTLASALGVSRSAVNHRLRRLVSLAAAQDTDQAEPRRRRGGRSATRS
jgi:cell division protein WhiA